MSICGIAGSNRNCIVFLSLIDESRGWGKEGFADDLDDELPFSECHLRLSNVYLYGVNTLYKFMLRFLLVLSQGVT